eukprot:jgi/Mesvir1/21578/Mv04018-RA.1
MRCEWSFVADPAWQPQQGIFQGSTLASTTLDGEDMAIWSHPIDVKYSTTTAQGWPKLCLTIYQRSVFIGMDEFCAYAICSLPTTPGMHSFWCSAWRPNNRLTRRGDEIAGFFTGRLPQLADEDFIHSRDQAFSAHIQTIGMGKLQLKVAVILRDFAKNNIFSESVVKHGKGLSSMLGARDGDEDEDEGDAADGMGGDRAADYGSPEDDDISPLLAGGSRDPGPPSLSAKEERTRLRLEAVEKRALSRVRRRHEQEMRLKYVGDSEGAVAAVARADRADRAAAGQRGGEDAAVDEEGRVPPMSVRRGEDREARRERRGLERRETGGRVRREASGIGRDRGGEGERERGGRERDRGRDREGALGGGRRDGGNEDVEVDGRDRGSAGGLDRGRRSSRDRERERGGGSGGRREGRMSRPGWRGFAVRVDDVCRGRRQVVPEIRRGLLGPWKADGEMGGRTRGARVRGGWAPAAGRGRCLRGRGGRGIGSLGEGNGRGRVGKKAGPLGGICHGPAG